MQNQFGIQLAGAREPIYIVEPFATLRELKNFLLSAPLVELKLVGEGTALVNHLHVVVVSGPNSPRITELFKK